MSTNEMIGRRPIRTEYTPAFYDLPADVQTKISIYNALTPEQREDRREDALQRQMEDSWDEYEPDWNDVDEEDLYGEFGQLAMLDSDLYALQYDLTELNRDLVIMEQCLRALKGDTCTALVVWEPVYWPTRELELAVDEDTNENGFYDNLNMEDFNSTYRDRDDDMEE